MSSCWQPIRFERSVYFLIRLLHQFCFSFQSANFCWFFSSWSIWFISPSQDLSSPNQYDTGVALTGLSCFVTPDLARDLANDIMTLVSEGAFYGGNFSFALEGLHVLFFSRHFSFCQKWVFYYRMNVSCFYCFPIFRCLTLNPTSERKLCWSCTRCFWSTPSPCGLLSPGSRRNWRIQIQVSAKALHCLICLLMPTAPVMFWKKRGFFTIFSGSHAFAK